MNTDLPISTEKRKNKQKGCLTLILGILFAAFYYSYISTAFRLTMDRVLPNGELENHSMTFVSTLFFAILGWFGYKLFSRNQDKRTAKIIGANLFLLPWIFYMSKFYGNTKNLSNEKLKERFSKDTLGSYKSTEDQIPGNINSIEAMINDSIKFSNDSIK